MNDIIYTVVQMFQSGHKIYEHIRMFMKQSVTKYK